MFNQILHWSVTQAKLTLILLAILAAAALYQLPKLSIDAVPDITNVQVQVNTSAPGMTPLEIEQQVTFVIEQAMAGLPKLDYTRSFSRYGLSQVTVVFDDNTDLYFARQLVSQRLQQLTNSLPNTVTTSMAPASTGLGEILIWSLRYQDPNRNNKTDLMQLRQWQDWTIKPQLLTINGVAEVNALGSAAKQYQIVPDLLKMRAHQISLPQLLSRISELNLDTGAGFIERNGEQLLVRLPNQFRSVEQIKQAIIKTDPTQLVRLKDIASVQFGTELLYGAASQDGQDAVLGTVMMLIGSNSQQVTAQVKAKLKQIEQTLPDDIELELVYDRSSLIDKTISTVSNNLSLGALLVISVLFLLLGHLRAAIITACVIPLSFLATTTGMQVLGISANLMSLGALDFGIIIDGAVVIIEASLVALRQQQTTLGRTLSKPEKQQIVFAAAKKVRGPLLFGQLIVIIVYLPLLALEGVEGKLFSPMAVTMICALTAASLLTISFVPAAIVTFYNGDKSTHQKPAQFEQIKLSYQNGLTWLNQHLILVISISTAILLVSGYSLTKMGSQFMPELNEGDIAMHAIRIPSTNLTQSVQMQQQLERKISQLPEVKTVFSRIGTAEIANDPMPPSVADTLIMVKDKHDWPDPSLNQQQLIKKIKLQIEDLIGNNYEFTQPIRMRFNELLSGVRSDVAIKLYGDDIAQLKQSAERINNRLLASGLTSSSRVESVIGLPTLSVQVKPEQMAFHQLSHHELQQWFAVAIPGLSAGFVLEQDKRFALSVRLDDQQINDIDKLRNLPIVPASNPRALIRLKDIAELHLIEGPNQISRENGKRRIVISANIKGDDLSGFIQLVNDSILQANLPKGYWWQIDGQFKQLQSTKAQFSWLLPLLAFTIVMLLYQSLRSIKQCFIVLSVLPFALSGGLLLLVFRDMPLSISAGVGFIALSGVALMNALVLLSQSQLMQTQPFIAASQRLRPVLMTALVAVLGFLPMALSTSVGAEVQRPLATVVIGGMLTSTLVTLVLLPLLYQRWFATKVKPNQ